MSHPSNDELAATGKSGTERQGRCLVLCFDGSNNLFDEDNTNAVHLISLLKKEDYNRQLVYYQTGVGTYLKPGHLMPFMASIMKVADFYVAWNIDEHIMGGYAFLMHNWLPGDKIYLFGISRGACEARALAGMLDKVGLLPRGNTEQIAFAYQMYSKSLPLAPKFKEKLCTKVDIEFVGVWETVSSVGLLKSGNPPFAVSPGAVKVFRQALALDEHRGKFRPDLYHTTPSPRDHASAGTSQAPAPSEGETQPLLAKDTDGNLALAAADDTAERTDWDEVWFAGTHGDVCGGEVLDTQATSLSRIPFIWMLREVVNSGADLLFDEAAVKKMGIDLSILKPTPKNQPKRPIHELDAFYEEDVAEELHDSLQRHPVKWWPFELWPSAYHYERAPDDWIMIKGANWGRPRPMPENSKLHVSVKRRREVKPEYIPRAAADLKDPLYVD